MVYRDPATNINATPSSTSQLGTQFVVRGSMKKMRYRAEYGYAGHRANTISPMTTHNSVGGKFLWEWQLPFITPKVELSRFANRTANDLARNHSISTRQKYSLGWKIPNWPSFTLSYGREQKATINQAAGSRSHATVIENVRTKIAYEHPIGTGEWLLEYSTLQNDIHDQGTLGKYHSTFKGTVRLFQPIDVTPSIGFTKQTNAKQNFSQERLFANLGTTVRLSTHHTIQPSFEWIHLNNHGDATTSNTLFSKLQYSYRPDNFDYHISAAGQYVLNKRSQQVRSPQSYDLSFFLKKDLHGLLNLPHQEQFMSLKLSYNQQINSLSTRTQQNSSSAMLLFSLVP